MLLYSGSRDEVELPACGSHSLSSGFFSFSKGCPSGLGTLFKIWSYKDKNSVVGLYVVKSNRLEWRDFPHTVNTGKYLCQTVLKRR